MYAAIAGLRTHMQNLNVIGNNVANVNTYGYKARPPPIGRGPKASEIGPAFCLSYYRNTAPSMFVNIFCFISSCVMAGGVFQARHLPGAGAGH